MRLETLLSNTLNKPMQISLTKLRRQAKNLGYTIQIDRVGRDIGYWIEGTDEEDETYCGSKEELAARLNYFSK